MYIEKNLTDLIQCTQRVRSRKNKSVHGITNMKTNVSVCSHCRRQGHLIENCFGFQNPNSRLANGHIQNMGQDTQKPYYNLTSTTNSRGEF
jgi:hypothetical protein